MQRRLIPAFAESAYSWKIQASLPERQMAGAADADRVSFYVPQPVNGCVDKSWRGRSPGNPLSVICACCDHYFHFHFHPELFHHPRAGHFILPLPHDRNPRQKLDGVFYVDGPRAGDLPGVWEKEE